MNSDKTKLKNQISRLENKIQLIEKSDTTSSSNLEKFKSNYTQLNQKYNDILKNEILLKNREKIY